LDVDERRRRLLALGRRLFTEHAYDEISMAAIAREAGISKALLYHYFPGKQAYFVATLTEAAEELRGRTEPDDRLGVAEQLAHSLGAFLSWIEDNEQAYVKVMQSATSHPEVREVIGAVREATARRIIDGLGGTSAAVETAVRAWLWFMDGACLDWLQRREIDRATLQHVLLGALFGALQAAGGAELAQRVAGS
jgi:AcrR family transcriptional regulator